MIRATRVRGAVTVMGVLVALAGGLLGSGPAPAHADNVEVVNAAEKSDTPTSLTFSARARGPAGIKSARLTYKVRNPDGDVGGGGDVAITPGPEVDLSFTLTTNSPERYIPVGSTFSYHWEVEDTTGTRVATPEKEFVFLDGRYQWRSRTEGTSPPISVYWYGGNESRATIALEATRVSLARTGELLETTVPYPVKVVVYASEQEGEAAQRSRGRAFDASVQTGGTRVAPDLVLVFVPDVDIVRHEVGHIVTHVAGDGPFGSLPSWIDEGTAVWSQSSAGGGYLGALGLAIQSNQTLNLRSLNSPTNKPEEVNLFYGQSFSTVDYMIKTYGQQKFAEAYRTFRGGTSMDDALKKVYGFDQNALYNEWRKSKGLPELTFATPVAGGVPATEATRPPLGFPTTTGGAASQPAAPQVAPESPGATDATSNGTGVPPLGLVVLLGTVVVALALGGGAAMLLRKRPA